MPTTNRIITRGMGTSRGVPGRAGMVTQGFGGSLFIIIKQAAERVIRLGQSGAKRALRELDEVVVWAKLLTINDDPPPVKVEGFIRVKVNKAAHFAVSLAEHVSTRVRKAWEDIKITVERLR